MSLRTVVFGSLCLWGLTGALRCPAQTLPPGGGIIQSNGRYVYATAVAVITDASGTVSVSPTAIGNLLDTGPSPSGLPGPVVFGQDDSANVSSRILAPAGAAALVVDGPQVGVTVAASAFGNKAGRSDQQTGVALTQTLSGNATVSVVNNLEVDNTAAPISDTPSAFGNSYDGSLAFGSLVLSQSTTAANRSAVNDNSNYTNDTGGLTIRPSAYGNFAILAMSTAGQSPSDSPSATQTNAAVVTATYNGTLTGVGGAVVIAPLAVGNYATTQASTAPRSK